MPNPRNVAVIVGSLRQQSFNRQLAMALQPLAAPGLDLRIVEIGALPLFNQDLEPTPPQEWVTFRQQIAASDAVLFITPEYNRSVPAALKNAVDVGSRPYGQSVWRGKPAAVISSSPGAIGGFGANHHLRQSLVFLDMPLLQQPEAYISGADKLFDGQGGLAQPATRDFMQKFLRTFEAWIGKTAASGAA